MRLLESTSEVFYNCSRRQVADVEADLPGLVEHLP